MNVEQWLASLDERYLADLTVAEVTRALRALSSCYVERREKLAAGGALDGAGKRAAFALFYGPQHFFITRAIVRRVQPTLESGAAARPVYTHVVDLGCGTGSAGAAAALECGATSIEGFDVNSWAVREANWTYRAFGLSGRARVVNMTRSTIRARAGTLIVAAYSINELSEAAREVIFARMLEAHRRGAGLLVIEPIGRRVNRWWDSWAGAVRHAGGREDDWRLPVVLPPRQRTLARAAGLDVQVMTARSLYLERTAD